MISSRARPNAFTLLELMIAMAISAVVAVILAASVRTAFLARDNAARSMQAGRSATFVMDAIRDDLLCAMPPVATSGSALIKPFEGTNNPNGDGNDDLVLSTTTPASLHVINGASVGNGDIKQVEITAYQPTGATETILVRRTWNNLLAPQQENPDEEVLCHRVHGFTLQYFDGANWLTSWDSTQESNALPVAMQATLIVESGHKNTDGSPVLVTYQRMFQLPCQTSNSSGSTGGSF